MPTKSSKTSKTATKPVKKTVKSSTVKKSSAKGGLSRSYRTNFVASVVVGAAALIAIAIGFSTYTKPVAHTASLGLGSLYLQQQKGQAVTAGSTVQVELYANSGTQPVNAVQSAIHYPSDKLEFVSVKTSSAFPQEAATDTATAGLIRLARSTGAGAPAVTGAKPVATLEFKVIKDTDAPTKLGIDMAQSLLVRSTDNKNIL